MMQGNKIYFTSLGCARNLVDSEVMLGILLKAGYEPAAVLEEADFLIVNTCGFLAESRKESCDTIDALLREKKKGAKVIVAGCMVQKYGSDIRKQFPEVHYFLGSGDMEKILEAVETKESGQAVTSAKSYLQQGEVPRQVSTPKHYAYLKIAEGCLKRCSFCIIPNIKGNLKSKSEEQVLKEFNILLNSGVFEVILIAQDLGDWGKERKIKDGLEKLLRSMLSLESVAKPRFRPKSALLGQNSDSAQIAYSQSSMSVSTDADPAQKSSNLDSKASFATDSLEKNFWLRLLYLYPDEITDGLIDLICQDQRICRYLDMPIQHINDTMLKAMRRKTNRAQIEGIIAKLREKVPGIVIRTSLMVGFPGETEEQFQELCDFVRDCPLDNVGIFKYSREEESHSASLPGHIDEAVKQDRFERLVAAQKKSLKKRSKAYIGKKLQVIVEGYHPDSNLLMRGRFYGQCPEIDGQVILNDTRKVTAFGKLYDVEITDVSDYDLIGRVLGPVASAKKSSGLCLASS